MQSIPINRLLFATIISLAAVVRGAAMNTKPTFVSTMRYTMGDATVNVCQRSMTPTVPHHVKRQVIPGSHDSHSSNEMQVKNPSNSTEPSDSPLQTIDLTPAKFNITCYPGTFQAPLMEDCDVVIAAQLLNSTGSLVAFPGDYVFVSYGTCATVFQNPQYSNLHLEYNWAELGAVGHKLANKCLMSHEDSKGGAAEFKPYLGHPLPEVMMSLQRFDDRDFIIQQ